MKRRGEVKGSEAKARTEIRVWGSTRGSVRTRVSGPLPFPLVPLDVLRRIVEAKVAK